MIRNSLVVLVLLSSTSLISQTAISGKIELENKVYEPKVFLTKLSVDHIEDLKYAKSIAWSEVKKDGTFSFDKKHIADKDALYRLHIKRSEKTIHDTIPVGATFILSNSDVIDFSEKEQPFASYINSNQADKEWKKFKAFEAELKQARLVQEERTQQLKSYTKDSLRILMVKLIGIKQLQEKQLLDQDIDKNPDYYLALLEELKESDIPRENYLFLEKKLAFLTQEVVESRYVWSRALNLALGLVVIGLIAALYFSRKKKPALAELSRQERNIQKLILQGKTNKEIANELFISLSTVKTHISSIYSKLRVSNRKELFHKIQKQGGY